MGDGPQGGSASSASRQSGLGGASAATGGGGRGIYGHVDGGLPVALRLPGPLAQTERTSPLAGTERRLDADSLPRGQKSGIQRPLIAVAPSLRDCFQTTGAGRPSGRGGGRGKYSSADGDLPGAAEYLPGPAKRPDLAKELPGATVMHVNIHGLRSHLAELSAVIRLSAVAPDVVCVNETFLDKGVGTIELEGFEVVGRRDRNYSGDDRNCGGVIVFAKTSIVSHVTLLLTSENSERLWLQLHTDNGPYLLCSWYRPPVQGEVESINSFVEEFTQLRAHALGTLLMGDLNLHCRRWLTYSDGNTREGEMMRDICLKNGLRQLVREPTRCENLLDLVLTDIESASVSVTSKIADHSVVTTRLNLTLPQTASHERKVWSYAKADWDGLKKELQSIDWSFIACSDASTAAALLTKLILEKASKHIPQRTLHVKKSSHPWLTDTIVQLVEAKRAAVGPIEYEAAVKACSDGIMAEYNAYSLQARQALLKARTGSKQWWNISRELLSQLAKPQQIPAMKSNGGGWVHEPADKADLLAKTFGSKNVLPQLVTNEYTDLEPNAYKQKTPCPLREQAAEKTLADLDEHSGTGPDLLPARILKYCAKQLAFPVLQLALLIWNSGEWPESWRVHWIAPIYKRGAVFLPQNYRGVHLTAQLSKVIERLLLPLIEPHISLWSLAGKNQFAYTKKKGSRDVLALLTMRWVKTIDAGLKVLVYCSDVSGAFDKVPRKRLLDKLSAKGIHRTMIKLIGSWLERRDASVVVGGARSSPFCIQDMVYQGTVLGPQLWNLFFEDAASAINEVMFEEVVYADDLNAYKVVPDTCSVEFALESIDRVQKELHKWGDANQVTFDSSKESKHILSRTDPHGEDFKLLGVVFDCRLDMQSAIASLVGRVKWKLVMLLRSRRSFSTPDLVLQYKQQVLTYIEYRSSAIYHATSTALRRLDRLQDSFLKELGITREAALMDFNLAPLATRRDIAMLGLLHRAAIGEGPSQFREHFKRRPNSLQLEDILATQKASALMKRSIWGQVKVYNSLRGALQCSTVKDFQWMLQERAKRVAAKKLADDWATLYSPR